MDEVNIIIIVISGSDGSNRKMTSLLAKTGKGSLLMFNILDDIRMLARWINCSATAEAVAIQLRNNQVFGRLRGQVIVQQRRIGRGFDSSDIAIAR